jgi:DNA-binding protein HU-beta
MANKRELIEIIAENGDLTKKRATELLEIVLQSIKAGIEQDGKVALVNFGTFEVRERAEKKGRNPQTGEDIVIPAYSTIVFKPSKNLKELVND